MYKYKIIILIMLLALSFKACDLDETMYSGVTASDHYATPDGFRDLSIAMYEPLRFAGYGDKRGGIVAQTKGTDLFKYGTGARSYWADYFGIHSAVQSMTARGPFKLWAQFYRGINFANSAIDRADGVEMSAEEKTRIVAEAHFLRAFYYHVLIQQYCNLHLTLEETQGVETEVNYVSGDEVWPHVISDLEFAAANLPPVQNELGRATSGAAKHLLARVHLVLGNHQEAADLATDLIDSGKYELEDSVLDLWDPCTYRAGNVSKETIFTITKNQETRDGSTVHKSREFAARTRGEAGVTACFSIGTQVARHQPTKYHLTEIYGNTRDHPVNQWNDERWRLWKQVWYFNDEAGVPRGTEIGDTALYFTTEPKYQEMSREELDALQAQINPGARIFRMEDYTDRLWPSLAYKFRLCDPAGAPIPHKGLPVRTEVGGGNPDYFGRSTNVFRLAETYLIAAEALMFLNQSGEGVNYLNAIRARAEAPGETMPLVSAADLDIDLIMDERARELVGENLRWYDLRRLGEDEFLRRIREHNPQAAPNVQAYHMCRPIPQQQIDRTTNDFPQNPGY